MKKRNPEDYRSMLTKLLPPGLAWSRRPDSNLGKLLWAAGDGLARVDAEAHRLISEANPLTATEALVDWERVLGLPDKCTLLGATLEDRRKAVMWKLNRPVGQNAAFFIAQAAILGYEIEIEEFDLLRADVGRADDRCYECPTGWLWGYDSLAAFRPARADVARAGDRCYDWNGRKWDRSSYHGWRFVFAVIGEATFEKYARADEARAGDRLREWGNPELECRLNQIKPAHTFIMFWYPALDRESAIVVEYLRADIGRADDRVRFARAGRP